MRITDSDYRGISVVSRMRLASEGLQETGTVNKDRACGIHS